MNELERTLLERIFPSYGFSGKESSRRASKILSNMKLAFPESFVDDYDDQLALAQGMKDQGDAHVLAAAVKTEAAMIVTENLKHFPADLTNPLNLEAKSADSFIADAISLDEGLAISAIREMRTGFKKPNLDASALLSLMESRGLVSAANQLRPFSSII